MGRRSVFRRGPWPVLADRAVSPARMITGSPRSAAAAADDGSSSAASPTTATASRACAPDETAAATAACTAVSRRDGRSTVAAA